MRGEKTRENDPFIDVLHVRIEPPEVVNGQTPVVSLRKIAAGHSCVIHRDEYANAIAASRVHLDRAPRPRGEMK